MENTKLHIVNGSAMLDRFSKGPWSGEVVAWEEAFIEGPLKKNILDDSFWKNRSIYFKSVYDISHNPWQTALFSKVRSATTYILWFEYDTFCQINMIGALTALIALKPLAEIHLVQMGKYEMGRDLTFGYATESEWQKSFAARKLINDSDREFLTTLWNKITSSDIEVFSTAFVLNIPDTFQYFKEAFHRIKFLFPDKNTRTNVIDKAFIKQHNNNSSQKEALNDILKALHNWGFGDLQISTALDDSDIFDFYQLHQSTNEAHLKSFLAQRIRTQQFSNFSWNDYVYNAQSDIIEAKENDLN